MDYLKDQLPHLDINTIQYIYRVAQKSHSQQDIEIILKQVEVPQHQISYIASHLFTPPPPTFKPITKTPHKQYSLIQQQPLVKKVFIDEEVGKIKQSKSALQKQDAKQRDEFAKRMIQKQRNPKNKKLATNTIVLSQQQKARLLPLIKQQGRLSFLQKRETQQIELFKQILKDQEKLFPMHLLTPQEQKIRLLNKKILNIAQNQKDKKEDVSVYKPPDMFQDQKGRIDNQKKNKVLKGKYVQQKGIKQSRMWQEQQIKKSKMNFRTKDNKQQQATKQYNLLKQNQIKFIKTDILRQLKIKRQELKEILQTKGEITFQQEETPLQKSRKSLPIYPFKETLLNLISQNQIVIMVGQTGSGKTTQLPQFLHQVGYTRLGKVGCTQPRRVAAMSVATRVAEQMGARLGQQVGFSIRFQDVTSDKTIIKYMTDGMMLKQFMLQPDLKSYSVIMIDQAHQRSLHTDILLSLIKSLALQRPELKLIISSATLQAQKFSEFFNYAPIIKIPGRRYPVDIFYTNNPEADYIEAAVITILQIHITQEDGDILCFLTGQEQIESAMEMLTARTRQLGNKIKELLILPIYASLPSELQSKIFETTPKNSRKVILATNIAQTSLTIDNIVYVIDSGFSKQTAFNPQTGMESLVVTPISKASANQRTGRAGRVCPGKCFRLYTLWSYHQQLEDSQIPQIQRTNLGNVVLTLKSMGINNLVNFDFMDPPPHQMLIRALQQLYALGALNDKGQLTKLGRRMAELPLDPMLSKTIIHSQKYKCVQQIITICAMISIGNSVFYRPKEKILHADNARKNFFRPGGDHITLLNVYEQWVETDYSAQWCQQNYLQLRSLRRARDIREQLIELCQRVQIDIQDASISVVSDSSFTNIRKCIASGFFYNTAKHTHGGSYRLIKNGHNVMIHPSSILNRDVPEFVVYHELVLTTKEYMRNVCEIEGQWMLQMAGHYFSKDELLGVSRKKQVIIRR